MFFFFFVQYPGIKRLNILNIWIFNFTEYASIQYIPQTAPQGLQTWAKSHKKATVFKKDAVMESDHFDSERNYFSLLHFTTNTAFSIHSSPCCNETGEYSLVYDRDHTFLSCLAYLRTRSPLYSWNIYAPQLKHSRWQTVTPRRSEDEWMWCPPIAHSGDSNWFYLKSILFFAFFFLEPAQQR